MQQADTEKSRTIDHKRTKRQDGDLMMNDMPACSSQVVPPSFLSVI
jgi:hypothetical protein